MAKFAANLSMLFTEVDFLERFDAAAQAGFSGVEYLFPYAFDAEQIKQKLEQNNLTQVLFNLPAGDWDAGDRGIACDPSRIEEFQSGVALAIQYAKVLGNTQVNCLAGITPAGVSQQDAHAAFVINLRYAAQALQEAGLRLVIEAINTRDIPGFFLNTTEQAKAVIKEVGSDNLFIQYDIYHMQIMEGDLAPTMSANIGQIAHVQLADNPGRHEPGTGEINYPFVLKHLDELGYQGWVGCEYKPKTTTTEGLDWLNLYR
ncbi:MULTISPECIES: hydroxypyruvate isomerase [Vibrio]|uniref:Hydroxypyruvate isomerase n=1 Tax=Vibrio coralliilyticus TaxID=190893 RepID=A0AAP6ZIG5_9VIBR|nr:MULTISPECIES: hydroxypyruvate isomerase [Vibrio]AIW20603.1 hydroxypyruvate isomerase [Vibrio coralliilyticus]ARC94067.1 hydroxypyruvate isomerase [Vibrio coralliilyticus]EEX32682.1 hydroxypyruvate isomerase [Vibrio coralliilyticus ATCC BAA-450]ERB65668.1 hydroxypyruvate isomerase [Vibrio coralliilyticus OCN008]KFI13035.1 hydroxypyruvate isomerase [Vibrio sp. B183]